MRIARRARESRLFTRVVWGRRLSVRLPGSILRTLRRKPDGGLQRLASSEVTGPQLGPSLQLHSPEVLQIQGGDGFASQALGPGAWPFIGSDLRRRRNKSRAGVRRGGERDEYRERRGFARHHRLFVRTSRRMSQRMLRSKIAIEIALDSRDEGRNRSFRVHPLRDLARSSGPWSPRGWRTLKPAWSGGPPGFSQPPLSTSRVRFPTRCPRLRRSFLLPS